MNFYFSSKGYDNYIKHINNTSRNQIQAFCNYKRHGDILDCNKNKNRIIMKLF